MRRLLSLPKVPVWVRYALGAQAGLLVGMGLGRFGYSPMIPPMIQSGSLSEAEAGYVGAANLAAYVLGALLVPQLRRRWHEADILRACLVLSLASLAASILPWGFAWHAIHRWWIATVLGRRRQRHHRRDGCNL